MLEFLGLMGMSLLITSVVLAGFWFGFKVVDIATGGEISKIFRR